MKPSTLIIFIALLAAYGTFIIYLPSPPHLPFESPPLPYSAAFESCIRKHNPDFPARRTVQHASYNPEPDILECLSKLMKIPSTKYASDSTQILRILADRVYNSSLIARSKFNRYITVHAGNLSSNSMGCLRNCEEMSDNILNYWEHGFMNDDPPYFKYGTLEHFWVLSDIHVQDCRRDFNCTDNVNVKEFMHSVFDEIDELVLFGKALTYGNDKGLVRLTELMPTPLVVHHKSSLVVWMGKTLKRLRLLSPARTMIPFLPFV